MGFKLKSGNTTSFKLMGGTEKSPAKAKVKTYSTKEEAPKKNTEKPKKKDDLSGEDFFGQPTKKSEKDALEIFLEKHLGNKKEDSPAKQYENPSDRKRETPGQYWYTINNRPATKAEYIKYKNKPGGDEPGKQTNDPDVYGRNKTNK
tara:strand:+ start:300 stop:740 length:441 start_codon:yes stop_codon:yes gene_type:complete